MLSGESSVFFIIVFLLLFLFSLVWKKSHWNKV